MTSGVATPQIGYIVKDVWKRQWIAHAQLLASMSPCGRGKVGALIIDARNNVVSSGFNGPPRGVPGSLCGGDFCERDKRGCLSGEQTEVGCHHAEQNALMNACARGAATQGCTLVTLMSPCLACAKLIHHAGIAEVITWAAYDPRGAAYLANVGVPVEVVLEVGGEAGSHSQGR